MLIQECAAMTAQVDTCATYTPLTYNTENPPRRERGGSAARRSGELLEPRAAAVELIEQFTRIARALSPRDPSTQDDLVQEMCLAALECSSANTRAFFLSLGAWRAKDFLLRWKQGSKIPIQALQRCDKVLTAC